MRNLRLLLRFVGTGYCGWQVQKNGVSIMEKIQDAIQSVTGVRSDVKGCSRTDSGVHAYAYSMNFKTGSPISADRMAQALNAHLPEDIAVTDCEEVGMDFHARYFCSGKEYLYQIHASRKRNPFLIHRALEVPSFLDVDSMARGSACLVGKHDFRSFCSVKTDQEDTVRRITQLSVTKEEGDLIAIRVEGDGFLQHMVRIIVGTLIWVGRGKLHPEEMASILAAKDRSRAGNTAPAHGLYLNRVFY